MPHDVEAIHAVSGLQPARLRAGAEFGAEARSAQPTLDPLIWDLVDWVAREPRVYADVIEAWRTSCPRLTVWEDACDRGFVERRWQPAITGRDGVGRVIVHVTSAGRGFLSAYQQQHS